MRLSILALLCVVTTSSVTLAQDDPAPKKKAAKAKSAQAAQRQKASPPAIAPTLANVAYGDHPRQVLDFWKAESKEPTPLLFFIHGGGWMAGDKSRVSGLQQYLDAGISVVSINYRYVSQAYDDGVKPPVKAPLHDAARALQFVRSKAEEWNLDKTRVAASGGSAGACSSLWLAFHDDLADPNSSDPVARESTRLTCAAVNGAQTTLDPAQMKEWTPNSRYGSHAFGIFQAGEKKYVQDFQAFLAKRDEIKEWIAEYSPYALVSSDDVPVYLSYGSAPALGQNEKDPTHSANFGLKLKERMQDAGVACELAYPQADVKHKSIQEFVIASLTQ